MEVLSSPTSTTPNSSSANLSTTDANNNNSNGKLDELKKINLSKQKIYQINSYITEYANQYKLIRELNLDNNLLGEIPSILRELKQLDVLSMQSNYIMEIPKWVSTEYQVLRRLNLSKNSIQRLPDNFNQMNLLEDLDLSFNIIGYIPPSHFPHNLVTLNLSNNQLQEIELPPWHENLIELDLSSNKLKYLGQIPYHLTRVHLDDNRLLQIDHKVIQRYRDLRLKFNQSFSDVVLERIYQCWYNADPFLDLSGIGLSSLPSVIRLLSHLTSLDLSGNCLSVLPPELESLTNLTRLDLSYNIISTLPLYLLNFKNLQFLGLTGTLDHLVSPPRKIAEGGIQEIVRYFQDLFVGDPSFRVKLMIVGQENVGKTSLVKCLKMKKKFNRGFDHLGSNVSTDGIDIDEIKFSLSVDSVNMNSHNSNYLNSLVINSGSAGSAIHQQSLLNQLNPHSNNSNSLSTTNTTNNTNSTGTNSGSNSANNSNQIAVNGNSSASGGGEVNSSGSTPTSSASSRDNALSQPPPPPIPNQPSLATMTSQLAQNSSSQTTSTGQTIQKITMSIWDCAGQELYYTSHQMFLTDSAFYCVVWDLCKPEVNSRVEFWLHSVRSKAENAPIILIGTHLDSFLESHSEQELDDILATVYTKYFRKFRLKGICVVSCATGAGFDNFQDLLKKVVSELPSIKQPLPELYTKLEKLIVKKRTTLTPPILSWPSYSQMVLGSLDFHDDVHVKVATKSLVNLGILSYFDEPVLENYVFLDPQWLTSVFASIITTKHKFIKDGILKRSDLYQIWKPPNYLDDEVLHGLLISLLERFELMFPLDNIQHSHYSTSQISSMNLKASNNTGANQGTSSGDSLNSSITSSFSSMTSTSGNSLTISHRSKSPQISNRSINGKNSIFGTTKKKHSSGVSTLSILASSNINNGLNQSGVNSTRMRSNSDGGENGVLAMGLMSPTMTSSPNGANHSSSGSGSIETIPEQGALNSSSMIDFNQKFMIPTQLPEKRPSFDLLWPLNDQSRIEYNRWFQLTFVPSGLFSRLLIRFMTSKEFDIKPILYWRNGVIVESSSGRGYLSTSMALIEMVPSISTGITTLMISVRGNRRTGKAITAKLLRLIVEITESLCQSWYHLELTQVIPCPHCVLKSSKLPSQNGRPNPSAYTLFTLEKCEMAASNGEWFLQCGNRKINLESFVPDVAMSDFWGTGSKKFNYDQIQLHKEKRIFIIRPSEQVNGFTEVRVINPMISPVLSASNSSTPLSGSIEKSPTNDIPVVCHVRTIPKDSPVEDDIPVMVFIDQKTQTIQITGTVRQGCKELEVEFQLPKLIGRGASGKIYRAELNGTMVAVKQLEVQGDDAPRIFSEFRKEIHVMSDLKHNNVVNLIGFTLNPFTMIMEYIDCGDLHKFLHSPVGEVINGNWALVLKLALDIAKGMEFLHSVTPPLLHRDLKSPNILLAMKNGHYQAKVGDFGLSSRMFIQSLKHKLRNFPVGNITWVAPEILREEEYTVKSDVYAFGLILHELLTRKHPYKEFNYQMVSLLEEAIKSGLRPTIPLNCVQSEMGHEYCALIRDCWDNDVERRPTFTKIVKRLKQIIARDTNNELQSPGSPLSMLALSGTGNSFDRARLVDTGLSGSMSPVKGNNLPDGSSGNLANMMHNQDEIALGGQLQMNIRAPMECNIQCLVWENRRVWGGCDNGSFIIWNAENGNKIMQEYQIHPGPIHNLLLVDDENVWSSGGVGSKLSSIRVWNSWRLNMDDQPRFKTDYIKKKGRGTSTFSRKWSERWFVLDKKTKTLNYYHKPTDKAPSATFSMEGASIENVPSSPLRALVTILSPEKRVLELEFKTEQEKNQWAQAINRSINQNIPIHEIRMQSYIPSALTETDYISQMLVVQPDQVWVSFKQNPIILVFSLKTRELVEKIDLTEFDSTCDSKWKGTDKMILHQGFVWLSGDTLIAQIDRKSYQVANIQSQHQQAILSIASIDSSVWVSCQDSSISIWDGSTGTVCKRIETKLPVTKLLQFSGYVWATSFSNILIYDPQHHTLKKQIDCKQHTNSIKDLIRVFHQTVWSCCGSNNVCIWS
ncbi:pleckstrin (PH) domain-containing protein [Tieghemostelium lacteum]|uniref:non-specific serine/threonine protein kinase n=1 Tax=Tieghemostelium lacteum TaxID=361077 RepID=A0A151ZAI3_TIELA|nr:pleckstrin (PH) domain-containing protein [Tieghemostelium lacteum]|eukprot:KYQ90938.1 pleckstrin (PH) domain-containing protein [Tieghemostelium lacteum]